jgi:uncharacterized protein (TIGR02996 family)
VIIPDDDEGRLVIADELTARGDPRGEFIHVQIQLARDGLDTPEAPELVRLHDRLVLKHARHWVRVFHGHTHHHRFRRGFIERIAIETERALTDELFAVEAVRDVHLLYLEKIEALIANPVLARVRGLSVNRGTRATAATASLSSPFTETLEKLESSYVAPIRPGPRVRRLFMSGAEPPPPESILALPELVELSLNGQASRIVDDPRCARLEEVELSAAPVYFASPHLAPRRLRIGWVNADALVALVAWPPFARVDELWINLQHCRDVRPLLESAIRPRRLSVHADQEQLRAILTSPIVERVVAFTSQHPRQPPDVFDGKCLPRLVVLDARAMTQESAHKLIRSRALPRLARVVYADDRSQLHPLDRAPL